MRPLFDRVLVKRDPLPEKKVGSIFLPDDNSIVKVSPWGTVIEVGTQCTTVKKGDRILFHQFATFDFDKSENLVIVKEDDILGREDAG